MYSPKKHIVQTPQWAQFKSQYGTKAVQVDEIFYTLHKIPFTNFCYGYCPKVNPQNINWEKLTQSAKENNCFVINFDTPNVMLNTPQEQQARQIFANQKNVQKSPKHTFTKYNIFLDLTETEDTLFANMHSKHRYNVKYAQRNGVTVRQATTPADYEIFYNLMNSTAGRQKFLIHPKAYYQKIWELLHPQDMAHILIAEYQNTPLAAWMLFTHEGVLYYPYGASSEQHKNLFASNLIGWETIRFGKQKGCEVFDMWGACKDPNDSTDPEWGFTNFKLKFGGQHVEYIDSYDLVLNKPVYYIFDFVYPKVIKLLKLLKS
jgi:lipid II:glycine glycyltransferase (peptidoglycan interpeptide bridge formation enzyme)